MKKDKCTPSDITATEYLLKSRDVDYGDGGTQDDPTPANEPVITANVVTVGEEPDAALVADAPAAAVADIDTNNINDTGASDAE